MTLRHNCEKQGCYLKCTLPDWAMLQGCFAPTRVMPQDQDGRVYQNGVFLELEMKGIGELGPKALAGPQLRSIAGTVRQGNSVIVFWADDPLGKDIRFIMTWNIYGQPSPFQPPQNINDEWKITFDRRWLRRANLNDLRHAAMTWWQLVSPVMEMPNVRMLDRVRSQ